MYNRTSQKSSFLLKLIECCLVAFAIFNIYNGLILYLISSKFEKAVQMLNYLRLFDMILVISCVFFGFVYPIVWHIKEKSVRIVSTSRHAFFLAVIRCWLAVMIGSYGFAKIIGTQFSQNLVRSNSLIKDLSGFDLTWFYFAYSYPFSVIIALFQLTGAILLLFKKSVFLGACILLPVMLNIVIINFFYKISLEAKLNSIFFSIALFFILSLFWNEIKDLVIRTSMTLPNFKIRNSTKYLFRVITIGFAFFFIYYFSKIKVPEVLIGKWNVTTLIKGSDTLQSVAWLTDADAWKNVYLGRYGDLTVNPNPYVIEKERAKVGRYHYESKAHTLSIMFGKRKNLSELVEFQVTEIDRNHMKWIGQYQGKPLQVDLFKED